MGQSRCGYILPYIMHLAHLLLCKKSCDEKSFFIEKWKSSHPHPLPLLSPFSPPPPASCSSSSILLPVAMRAAGGVAPNSGATKNQIKSPLTTISDRLHCLLNAGRPWWKILIIHRKCCLLRHHIFPELADFQQLPPIVHSALINAAALLAFVPRQCT